MDIANIRSRVFRNFLLLRRVNQYNHFLNHSESINKQDEWTTPSLSLAERWTIREGPLENLWGDGRSTKKIFAQRKLNENNSGTPINPNKNSCQRLKKFLQFENSVTFLMVRPLQKFADNQILCWLIPCSQMSFRYKVSKKTRMRDRQSIKRPFNF